ncbi:ligase-associated DNA damage response exonuclease [Wenzhouxiangella sp. XN79A]|uniref:ligase-associated DNA damage response exonuclease n=1 Tax=Wenzhouxiangella sp. XN79A TaxID=2724193 RepID=UPI0032168B6A
MKNENLLVPSAGGLYCAAGDFWIDPLRPVPRAIITHAHADHARGGSEEYHTAEANRAILAARIGAGADGEGDESATVDRPDHHGHAWGEPFELVDTRITLFPAGHILGSSWVRIESEHGTWGVSGDFKRAPDPTCQAFEPADCDVWVTECTFGLPVYRWPAPSEVIDQVEHWWDECRAANRPAVLFCYALGKAQRVLAELGARRPAMRAWLHGAMRPLTDIYRDQGVALPETLPVSEAEHSEKFAGELVLAPPSAAGSPWMRRFPKHSAGFVSGWMRIRGNRRRRGYDRGFVMSDHADWPALIETVADQRARRVITIHGNGEPLAGYLTDRNVEAEAWNLRASLAEGSR